MFSGCIMFVILWIFYTHDPIVVKLFHAQSANESGGIKKDETSLIQPQPDSASAKLSFNQNFYRPQRSWGKVMFLHVSVILFTEMGGVVSQHALQVVSQHALQQGLGGGIPACLAGLQAHTQGEVEGVWPRGVSRPTPRGEVDGSGQGGFSRPTPRGYPSMHRGRQPPSPDDYCCGRYASYWNAFFFVYIFLIKQYLVKLPKQYLIRVFTKLAAQEKHTKYWI